MADEQTPAAPVGDEVVTDDAFVTYGEPEGPEDKKEQDQEGQEKDQPAEPEETPEDGEDEGKEKKSKSQLRRERRKAEMERVQNENSELQKQLRDAETRVREAQEAAQKLQPPKQSDFKDYDEFTAALSAYHGLKAMDKREAERVEREARALREQVEAHQAARAQQISAMAREHIEDGRERYADFDEVVLAPDAPITPLALEIIAASDKGADLAYWLGSHREEAARIAAMSPFAQARELGLIEGRLSAPQPKTISRAPAPPAQVKPKGRASKSPDTMTPSEYRAWREAGGTF